jgi:FMN phosphatase YigB (HAD superfamily)
MSIIDLDLRVATFDCYGTLVDWEGGAAGFLYQLALEHGDASLVPGRDLRDRWEAIQFDLLAGPWRP